MHRIRFFMVNDSTVDLEVTDDDYALFRADTPPGAVRAGVAADNQRGSRLGETCTIGVNWQHVASWQATKL